MEKTSSSGSSKTVMVQGAINIQSKDPIQGAVLRLVWDAGGPRDFNGERMAGRSFLPRPPASLVKNAEVFPR